MSDYFCRLQHCLKKTVKINKNSVSGCLGFKNLVLSLEVHIMSNYLHLQKHSVSNFNFTNSKLHAFTSHLGFKGTDQAGVKFI